MKKIGYAVLASALLFATPVYAGHSGLYSAPEKNCVAPIVALYWYHPAYAIVFKKINDRLPDDKMAPAPACWLGKASRAVGAPHRKYYLPRESRAIRAWFRERNPPIVTGTVIQQ